MTERVYKYRFRIEDWIAIRMERGAQVLSVQMQDDVPCMWVRVDTSEPFVLRHFRIAGTGHDLGSNVGRHIATFQAAGGALVFHVFEDAGYEAKIDPLLGALFDVIAAARSLGQSEADGTDAEYAADNLAFERSKAVIVEMIARPPAQSMHGYHNTSRIGDAFDQACRELKVDRQTADALTKLVISILRGV